MLIAGGITHVTLILDGDDAGRAASLKASSMLAEHLFVHSIVLQNGEKPDSMLTEIISQLPKCD